MTIKTIEDLDEMRAQACRKEGGFLVSSREPWLRWVRTIRAADEAAGLNTEALLAVLRGEAVIVPKVPTEDMLWKFSDAIQFWMEENGEDADVYRAMIAASPWAKKEDV